MGLENFVSGDSSSDSGSSSSGSSKSSSSSSGGRTLTRKRVPDNADEEEYPFYFDETPQHAIVRTQHGLRYKTYPETPSIRWAKFSPDSDWEKENDDHLKKVWWTDQKFNWVKHIVKDQLGADLVPLLKDDAEKADEAIQRAMNQRGWSKQEFNNTRDCACCGEEIDLTYGDYESVGTSIVCNKHTVEELAEEGVL